MSSPSGQTYLVAHWQVVCYNKIMKTIDRFWSKVLKGSKCWEWTATKINGYGYFHYKDKISVFAHRFIYWYVHKNFDLFDRKIHICHTCDNPSCVNPKHLWLGNAKLNSQDMFKKKRNAPATQGTLDGMAKLSNNKVIQIRSSNQPNIQLAKKYNVSPSTICDIKKRRSWKHI